MRGEGREGEVGRRGRGRFWRGQPEGVRVIEK